MKTNKEFCRSYYKKNKQRVIDRNAHNRKERIAWFNGLKQDLKCEICGDERWYLLNFHHTSEKNHDVSKMVHDVYSKKKIIKEIELCQTLCSNCHMAIHHNERHEIEEGRCVACGEMTIVKSVIGLPIVAIGSYFCSNWRVCEECWNDIQIHGVASKARGTHQISLGKPRFEKIVFPF